MPLCSVEPSSSHTLISFNNHESFVKTLQKSTHKGPNIFPMLFCHLQYNNIFVKLCQVVMFFHATVSAIYTFNILKICCILKLIINRYYFRSSKMTVTVLLESIDQRRSFFVGEDYRPYSIDINCIYSYLVSFF